MLKSKQQLGLNKKKQSCQIVKVQAKKNSATSLILKSDVFQRKMAQNKPDKFSFRW